MRAGVADVVGRHAGDRLGPLRRFSGQPGGVFLEPFGARRDERLVVQLFGHNHLRHRVEQGRVGAGFLAQPQLGEPGHLGLPRINDDQPGAVFAHRLLQEGGDDRMRFGGVGADHHEAFQVGHLGDGVAHGGGADGKLQPRDAAGVAQPGAVIDVVRADHRAQILLEEVAVLVRRLGAGVGRDAVRPVAVPQIEQPRRDQVERLVPACLAPVVRRGRGGALPRCLRGAADQRRGQPAGVMHEVGPEPPLDAQSPEVRRGVERRIGAEDAVILDIEIDLAPDAAVGAGGTHDPIRFHLLNL